MTRAVPYLALVLLTSLFAACTRGDAAPDAAAGPEAWQLETPAALSIGVVDGDENYQFTYIYTGLIHPDGRLMAIDGGRAALMVYDSMGVFLTQVGQRGQGPGEFTYPSFVRLYRGDSIAVSDPALRRVSIFDAQGNFARSFVNPVTWTRKPGMIPSQSCCHITEVFEDGSFVGHPPDDIPVEPGPPRYSTLTLVRVSPDGARQDTLGTFESAYLLYDASAPSNVRHYETSYYFRYALVGNTLIGGNGMADKLVRVTVEAGAGARMDSIPLPGEPRPFTPELQAEYEAALRADYERRGGTFYHGTLESNMPHAYPPFAPRFVNMFADADGRVWLLRWTPMYNRRGAPVVYDVITSDGRHVAHVTLPTDARPLWAGRGRVLVVESDSLDVQYLRVYRIRPPR